MQNIVVFLVTQLPLLLELTVGELIFAVSYRRKAHFTWRLLAALLAETALCGALYALTVNSELWLVSNTLYYLLMFAVSLILPFLCFQEEPIPLVFCAVCGYLLQHMGSQILQIFWNENSQAFQLGNGAWMLPYMLSSVAVYVPIFCLSYWLFARQKRPVSYSKTVYRNLVVLSVVTLGLVIVLSSVRDTYAGESFTLTLITRIFSVFCCLFVLCLRTGVLEQVEWEQERTLLRRINEIQREQYEQSRENIELINIKCHDLRHRMESWEQQGGSVDLEELRETRHMVNIYDSSVKTGNETLDTILTRHSLYCQEHGIRLSCIADGSRLCFLPVGEICALFGNALENAIEAVSRLERPEDRIISLQVREQRGMLVVLVDNNYTGELVFRDGLPQTSKPEGADHGFGLKSIRLVAEKYGGEMTVTADELFHLCVLLPVPEKA
ncbi:MAG: GHKL domain-containing protein [Clostridiales bacterium]|nr:GHKL domain-containing protein [Clostridiales bacterium]